MEKSGWRRRRERRQGDRPKGGHRPRCLDSYVTTQASLRLTSYTGMLSRVWPLFSPLPRDEAQRTHIHLQVQNSHSKNTSCPERGNCYELLWMPWLCPYWLLSRTEALRRDKRSGLLSTILRKMSITNKQVAKTWCSISQICPFPEKLQKCHPAMPAFLPHQVALRHLHPLPVYPVPVLLLYPCYHVKAQPFFKA